MTTHRSPLNVRGFFITGTDTGVGKTLIACALLHALAARGLRVVGMKPVAAGANEQRGRLVNDDVTALEAASNVAASDDDVNPYCFAAAIAPHIAAADVGVRIERARIRKAYSSLSRVSDCVVVEGAGGFRVPLGADFDTADVVSDLSLPVLLTVGVRLGCLSHALMTADAIEAAGVRLAGWVANHIDPHMERAAENVAALEARLRAPLIARIDYIPHLEPIRIARELDLDLLLQRDT